MRFLLKRSASLSAYACARHVVWRGWGGVALDKHPTESQSLILAITPETSQHLTSFCSLPPPPPPPPRPARSGIRRMGMGTWMMKSASWRRSEKPSSAGMGRGGTRRGGAAGHGVPLPCLQSTWVSLANTRRGRVVVRGQTGGGDLQPMVGEEAGQGGSRVMCRAAPQRSAVTGAGKGGAGAGGRPGRRTRNGCSSTSRRWRRRTRR